MSLSPFLQEKFRLLKMVINQLPDNFSIIKPEYNNKNVELLFEFNH